MLSFLTPKARAGIYAVAAAVFAILFLYGWITREQISAWMNLVTAAVTLLALLNTSWGNGVLAKVRGALYATATAVFGVLGVYGLTNAEQTAAWLSLVSTLIAVLAMVNVPTGDAGEAPPELHDHEGDANA